MLIFEASCLLSLKNGQMCPQKLFAVFSKNTPFFEKIVDLKIFGI